MKVRVRWNTASPFILFSLVTVTAASAQTFTTLVSFDGTNGALPTYGTLVQGSDGNFYGTTSAGGSEFFGTVFVITPQGHCTNLHTFHGHDGGVPEAGLIVAPDGTFYGTTHSGGANGDGTIFQITPHGTLTTLHSFSGADGDSPDAGLVLAFNGMLYGTTGRGGANDQGTIFRTTLSGTVTVLDNMGSGFVPLVQATNGMLYGTTREGGGTIYTVTLDGARTTLYSFCGQGNCPDGSHPSGALVQGTDGNFYGTTEGGGANDGRGGRHSEAGTVFRITPAGELTVLHSFDSADGSRPFGALVQGTDGNFYGTTSRGGANCLPDGCGTIFQITPSGTLATLHSFDNTSTDGVYPYGGLVQGTDGDFYGTTFYGGSNGDGVVFRLSMGLGPFVKTLPAFGRAGRDVVILGSDLTGTTSVTFNGIAAAFSLLSPTAIKATVPSGATTGTVQVVMPGATLSSNVPFLALP
jgi:uncharacterized repeat protein (TIGR03803 family)